MLSFLRKIFSGPHQHIPDAADTTKSGAEIVQNVPTVAPEIVRPGSMRRDHRHRIWVGASAGLYYIKSGGSAFWTSMLLLQPGSYARYESVGGEWHVFEVIGGPEYGRKTSEGGIGLSAIVRRVSTGTEFTMPAAMLRACSPSFRARDGSRIASGESYRDAPLSARHEPPIDPRDPAGVRYACILDELDPATILTRDLNVRCSMSVGIGEQVSDAIDATVVALSGTATNGWPGIHYVAFRYDHDETIYAVHEQSIFEIIEAREAGEEPVAWLLQSCGLLDRKFGRVRAFSTPPHEVKLDRPIAAIVAMRKRRDAPETLSVEISSITMVGQQVVGFAGSSIRTATASARAWRGKRTYKLVGYDPRANNVDTVTLEGRQEPIEDPATWFISILHEIGTIRSVTI